MAPPESTGAVACHGIPDYTDSPFLWIYEEVSYERRLPVMVNRYCYQLETEVLRNPDTDVGIYFCCIDFSSDQAWFMHPVDYWVADLNFEVRARQTCCDRTARVLVGLHKFELFASGPQNPAILSVGVDFFGWSSY